MSLTIKAANNGICYESLELRSKILNYLIQDYIVVLDNDLQDYALETLFENIRDNLHKLVQQGDINQNQFEKALANFITKSSLETVPDISPMVNIKMQMLAFIEEC